MSSGGNEKGFLTKAFMGAVKLATVGFVAAIAWLVLMDPIFFPIFHDPTNATAQAFVSFIHEGFSWVPDVIGLTGDGGFLNTEFMRASLAPHYSATPMEVAAASAGGVMSFESMPR